MILIKHPRDFRSRRAESGVNWLTEILLFGVLTRYCKWYLFPKLAQRITRPEKLTWSSHLQSAVTKIRGKGHGIGANFPQPLMLPLLRGEDDNYQLIIERLYAAVRACVETCTKAHTLCTPNHQPVVPYGSQDRSKEGRRARRDAQPMIIKNLLRNYGGSAGSTGARSGNATTFRFSHSSSSNPPSPKVQS